MKQRLFTLCLALTVVTFGAMAAEELYVGGKKVTLSGSGKVTVSGGDIKSGSVTYDRDTKTLTLKNVTITRSGNNNRGIRSSVSGLTVVFSGTNAITTTTAAGLRFEASATITGSGTVTVTTSETALYVYKNTTVTIKGQNRDRLTLSLSGQYGIQGETSSNGEKVNLQRWVTLTAKGSSNTVKNLSDLTISGDANVTLKGNSSNSTVNSLASLTLGEGIVIDLPLGGKFNSSYKTIPEGKYMIGYKGDITINLAKVAINESNFPDYNFRSYILSSYASPVIDRNSDGYLSNAEIQATKEIYVVNKSIKNLTGIGCFTALTELNCSDNSLKSLDVSKNTALTELYCGRNSLTSLDVSKNTALRELRCFDNSLKSLDVSKNTALTVFRCWGNQIKGTAMTNLVNSLPSLPSGTNGYFYVCADGAETDNIITNAQVNIAMGKGWTVRKYISAGNAVDYAGFDVIGIDATNFPDASFRSYLLAQDYGKDKILTESEIKGITEMYVSYMGIKDLKGIEHFTALTKLDCSRNDLKSLDVSNNKALTELYCSDNSLESLDVSKNTALTVLHCSLNGLKSMDVSKNTALRELRCSDNSLKSLDVSKNTALTVFRCCGNQIKGLAMTSLVNSLRSLPSGTEGLFYICDDGAETDNIITTAQVSIAKGKGWTVKKWDIGGKAVDYAGVFEPVAIDATNFPDENFRNYLLALDYGKDKILTESEIKGITEMYVSYMGIKDLTGIGYFMALTRLSCENNSLTSLDVSKNTALTRLYCYNNSLTSLDISKNTALTRLYCYNNSLQSLDVSKNTALTELDCHSNSLESLDVSKNTLLTELECSNNSLTSLDVSKNTALTMKLSCSSNSLQSLDVSKNTKLTDLYCSNNSLQSLDVSKNTALTDLYCDNNCLQSLDVSKNTALTWLVCSGNQISGTAMTKLVNSLPSLPSGTNGYFYVCDDRAETDNVITTAQVKVATDKGWTVQKYDSEGYSVDYAGEEPGIAIDATNFPDENFRSYLLAQDYGKDAVLTEDEILAITWMNVSRKGISNLTGIEYFTALTGLECSGNNLESLNISKNTALTELYCGYNSLTTLDISENKALTKLDCSGNQIVGVAMTQLVNNLPTIPSGEEGYLTVRDEGVSPDNIITVLQVKIAKDKGWKVLTWEYKFDIEYAGNGDVNSDNQINEDDLNFLVGLIMGKYADSEMAIEYFYYAGDLNNDGKVDAADIVVMNNILKELKGK